MNDVVLLGADAKAQAIAFALCMLCGVAGGAFCLLYFRRGSFFERALTDFFATIMAGGGFVLCMEFVLNGKFELFGAVAYALGALVLPSIFLLARKLLAKQKLDKKRRNMS